MNKDNLLSRITIDPEICFGKPCIKGTRIPIYLILELIESGYTYEKILSRCYPQLTKEDLRAAMRYAVNIIKNEEVLFSATA